MRVPSAMPMLHTPDRHQALAGPAWSDERALGAITAIVRDIEQQHHAGRWPLHPLDDAGDEPAGGFQCLYLGSAGLWWALWHLQREGAVVLRSDPVAGIESALRAYRALPEGKVPSYFLGEAGILLVHARITGLAASADELHAVVLGNIGHPANEALWAAPGTMLAAWHQWVATQEARWRELFLANVDQVWRTWLWDDKAGCYLWTQDLHGTVVQYFGAGHGFAGNVFPLLKGAALLDADRRADLYSRSVATLRALAVEEDGAVNWPPGSYTPRPGSPPLLMQWCHGAPGIVTALADFPVGLSSEMDALLLAAGEAVWRAGPLAKGHGLCHGTAGNGYALLKLYQRSGDARWLHRARAFAMHALLQHAQARQAHAQGLGRYTLWNGDAGLAVFLWHCHRGVAAMPGLDVI